MLNMTDLPEIVKDTCPHLEPSQQDMLLSLLLNYESLFDSTLGDWNRPPVSIELKDGAEPYHGRPYPIPIPQIHKTTLMKEIDRLMGIVWVWRAHFLCLKHFFDFAIKIILQALRFQPNRRHQSIQRKNIH
jgi:hypothetical protein